MCVSGAMNQTISVCVMNSVSQPEVYSAPSLLFWYPDMLCVFVPSLQTVRTC